MSIAPNESAAVAHHPVHVRLDGHVAGSGQRSIAEGIGDPIGGGGVFVVDGDTGAGLHEMLCHRATHALSASRYDGNLAGEVIIHTHCFELPDLLSV